MRDLPAGIRAHLEYWGTVKRHVSDCFVLNRPHFAGSEDGDARLAVAPIDGIDHDAARLIDR
jgi:hypothetical protein